MPIQNIYNMIDQTGLSGMLEVKKILENIQAVLTNCDKNFFDRLITNIEFSPALCGLSGKTLIASATKSQYFAQLGESLLTISEDIQVDLKYVASGISDIKGRLNALNVKTKPLTFIDLQDTENIYFPLHYLKVASDESGLEHIDLASMQQQNHFGAIREAPKDYLAAQATDVLSCSKLTNQIEFSPIHEQNICGYTILEQGTRLLGSLLDGRGYLVDRQAAPYAIQIGPSYHGAELFFNSLQGDGFDPAKNVSIVGINCPIDGAGSQVITDTSRFLHLVYSTSIDGYFILGA